MVISKKYLIYSNTPFHVQYFAHEAGKSTNLTVNNLFSKISSSLESKEIAMNLGKALVMQLLCSYARLLKCAAYSSS